MVMFCKDTATKDLELGLILDVGFLYLLVLGTPPSLVFKRSFSILQNSF